MTAPDPRNLSAAALAAELDRVADRLEAAEFMAGAAVLLREAARRIAPATAALADVPPRLAAVVDPDAPPCICLCHRLDAGLGYHHRTATMTGDDVEPCCSTPGRPYDSVERAAALLAAADRSFG